MKRRIEATDENWILNYHITVHCVYFYKIDVDVHLIEDSKLTVRLERSTVSNRTRHCSNHFSFRFFVVNESTPQPPGGKYLH